MFIEKDFFIKSLNRKRTITIYLPDDYQTSNKKYPVIYINDGQNAFFDEQSYIGVSFGFYDYVKKHQLDIIMVALPCNFKGNKRLDEYGPWIVNQETTFIETGKRDLIGGEGKPYVKFLVEQLKPYIDATYPTNANDTAICGSSMGGIISAYACFKYPHIFNKCAILSTAFWFYLTEFTHLINHQDLSMIEYFYMDFGGDEGGDDELLSNNYIESNDYIYQLLKTKIANLECCFYEKDGHSEIFWCKRVPKFMRTFYNLEK